MGILGSLFLLVSMLSCGLPTSVPLRSLRLCSSSLPNRRFFNSAGPSNVQETRSLTKCAMQCLSSGKCESINYRDSDTAYNNLGVCELLVDSATSLMDFAVAPGFGYYELCEKVGDSLKMLFTCIKLSGPQPPLILGHYLLFCLSSVIILLSPSMVPCRAFRILY